MLSDVVAEHANDIPASLLHDVMNPNSREAALLREQSVTQTQVLNMTGLLHSGVRFIDFRNCLDESAKFFSIGLVLFEHVYNKRDCHVNASRTEMFVLVCRCLFFLK
jgi:hypothetical protein